LGRLMSSSPSDFAIMHFSTEALPSRERVPMLREFIGPLVSRMDIEPLGDGPVHLEMAARAVPDLAVTRVAFSAIRVERTRKLMTDGNDNCSLSWLRSPGNTVVYRGNELRPADGESALLSMADRFVCATVGGIAHGVTISVPRKVLTAMVPRVEDRFRAVLVPESEAQRLLASYIEVLDERRLASAELRRLVVAHVHDLVALALGASSDVAELASSRGLRAARLHAIKTDIRATLNQQGMTLTAVAARHGVSPRYVQALFESDGTTFSQFLIGERLARAHHLLNDPLQMVRSISAIAYAAGFGDLSHFNRAFRRRYGATPTEIRIAARRERTP
jgi:AraC-like DNA-binding protein